MKPRRTQIRDLLVARIRDEVDANGVGWCRVTDEIDRAIETPSIQVVAVSVDRFDQQRNEQPAMLDMVVEISVRMVGASLQEKLERVSEVVLNALMPRDLVALASSDSLDFLVWAEFTRLSNRFDVAQSPVTGLCSIEYRVIYREDV